MRLVSDSSNAGLYTYPDVFALHLQILSFIPLLLDIIRSAMVLTSDQVAAYKNMGIVFGIPVFSRDEMDSLNSGLKNILALLDEGESSKEIREWHESSRFLFDLCMDERILDCVEQVLGDNFYLWASNFFIKEPRSPESVTWHQDAYYWPLDPVASCTVWLAFDDVDNENGGMTYLPGSHTAGILDHNRIDSDDSVLSLECDVSGFDVGSAKVVEMKAGSISIHADTLVHGSPGNPSDRRRAGLTMRYSPTTVKCDLSINPHFKTYIARGIDKYQHNPVGSVPQEKYARLRRQHASIEEAGEDAENKKWKSGAPSGRT
ncbi:MAG: phytanoyl-CoA dioxygenase family protein [Rhodothermales bacterium]|nr:phytanoyl-CoA dioxygenase family protein [Rhodothermales bacterium]